MSTTSRLKKQVRRLIVGPMRLSWRLLPCLLCFACLIPARFSPAQTSVGPTFDRCLAYGNRFLVLDEEFTKNRGHYSELMEQLAAIGKRLAQTHQDMQLIQNETVRKNLQSFELLLYERDLRNSLQGQSNSNTSSVFRMATAFQLPKEAERIRANNAIIESHMQQLDVAQRATVERRFKLLVQYQDTLRQLNDCFVEERRLTDAYIRHSDQAATRCQVELRSALRLLESAATDNYGAQLARAITCGRLGYIERSTSELDQLSQLPQPYSAIALAARLEITAVNSDSKPSRQEAKVMNSLVDPTVQYFRARTAAIQGNYAESLKLCERLLQVEAYQVQSLVLASLVNSHPDNATVKVGKSIEQSQLAVDLTGSRDWECVMALALAHAANKNTDKALGLADKAIELAIGNQRVRCQELRDAIAAGHVATWKF